MANTTPKMGLRLWDQLVDPYNHTQLADNWSKVDFHDHTPGRGVQIPTEGLATGAVTTAKLAVDPTYGVLETGGTNIGTGTAAGTYAIGVTNPGSALLTSTFQSVFYFTPADYLMSPRTTNLRLEGLVNSTNVVAPGINFTFGLFPITAVSASVLTVGAVVASSTVAINTPAANSLNRAASVDFAAPAAGYYALGVTTSGAMAASSNAWLRAKLFMRQS